jgi:hypothetical protein
MKRRINARGLHEQMHSCSRLALILSFGSFIDKQKKSHG